MENPPSCTRSVHTDGGALISHPGEVHDPTGVGSPGLCVASVKPKALVIPPKRSGVHGSGEVQAITSHGISTGHGSMEPLVHEVHGIMEPCQGSMDSRPSMLHGHLPHRDQASAHGNTCSRAMDCGKESKTREPCFHESQATLPIDPPHTSVAKVHPRLMFAVHHRALAMAQEAVVIVDP